MRVVASGDAIFASRSLAARVDPAIRAVLADADAVFANAEFSCPHAGTPPMPRMFPIGVPAWAIDELAAIGVSLFSAANNHAADFGPQGVLDTIEAYESRAVTFAGIGRTLADARAATFQDTAGGRIALVAASSTRSKEYRASAAGRGVAARPGLSPLRWGQAYVLPEPEFRQLRHIDELLGTAAVHEETNRVEIREHEGPDVFEFGSVFEGHVRIERGESPAVRYWAESADLEAILRSVRDAANRAETVLVSLHCHEGEQDGWYADRAASFIEDAARQMIDAGATAFFGHGPHMLRGIEFYRGQPIFYSLGSLLFEFEMGERLAPEVFSGYGLPGDALPSDLHLGRARDADGRPRGFYADPRFTRSVLAVCDIGPDGVQVTLVPVGLGLDDEQVSRRGLPRRPGPEEAEQIITEMARMSKPYGTEIRYDPVTMTGAATSAGAAR